jgi:hypothetical protein
MCHARLDMHMPSDSRVVLKLELYQFPVGFSFDRVGWDEAQRNPSGAMGAGFRREAPLPSLLLHVPTKPIEKRY